MPDSPAPSTGLTDILRVLAPYAPGFAGAVFSMAFGENLTIRGKLLSAAGGLASAWIIGPFLCDVAALWWPGAVVPTSVTNLIGFSSGIFGMVVLTGTAQALAKYSRDPLSLVRVKIGPVEIGRPSDPFGDGPFGRYYGPRADREDAE